MNKRGLPDPIWKRYARFFEDLKAQPDHEKRFVPFDDIPERAPFRRDVRATAQNLYGFHANTRKVGGPSCTVGYLVWRTPNP